MNIPHNRFLFFILFLFVLGNNTLRAHTTHISLSSHSHHQVHDKNRSHHDFSHNTRTNFSFDKSPKHQHNFHNYTAHDFQKYFTEYGYTEKHILNQRCLYMFDEFVKFAQTYSSYTCTIQQIHTQLKNLNCLQKAYYIAKGTYCAGLQKRIHFLYNELNTIKTAQDYNNHSSLLDKSHQNQTPTIRDNSVETFRAQLSEYKTLDSVYHTYIPSLSKAIDNRIDAFKNVTNGNYFLNYKNQSYNLNNNAQQLLSKYGYNTTHFTQCFGNQLHQAIHQESLSLLDRIDNLPYDSFLYNQQEALVDFTVSMVDYNHEDLTDKAMSIGDLCWTLLDCGQAVAEGAALGIYSAAHDIITNPIEATVCIVAKNQVLAYQLCKVIYNVADIGLTAATNFDDAKEKWNTYTEPLNTIIDAINKKEITLHDAVKGGTAFVVGWKTQGRLLGGLGKFCNTIKQNSINFVKNSPLLNPQKYFTTPEGLLFKATAESNKFQQSGQVNSTSKLNNTIEKLNETVWKNIKLTDKMYPGTKIPKSFELTVGKEKFWVNPNATKHMLEYMIKHLETTHSIPINSQTLLAGFEAAVKEAVSKGIQYDTMIKIGCWQFRFGMPRKEGLLPSIYHANFKPQGW